MFGNLLKGEVVEVTQPDELTLRGRQLLNGVCQPNRFFAFDNALTWRGLRSCRLPPRNRRVVIRLTEGLFFLDVPFGRVVTDCIADDTSQDLANPGGELFRRAALKLAEVFHCLEVRLLDDVLAIQSLSQQGANFLFRDIVQRPWNSSSNFPNASELPPCDAEIKATIFNCPSFISVIL